MSLRISAATFFSFSVITSYSIHYTKLYEYKRGFENVEPEEFSRLMRESHILIDVRTEEEYEEENILNAINIPLDELTGFIETLREQSYNFV